MVSIPCPFIYLLNNSFNKGAMWNTAKVEAYIFKQTKKEGERNLPTITVEKETCYWASRHHYLSLSV